MTASPAGATGAGWPARPTRTIDEVLAAARAGLRRLRPEEAADAVRDGAVIVDIRPQAQRLVEGEVPDSLVVERNVLEWRFDPASSARLPIARHDLQVVILCSEGYTSSLAASALQELGIHRATDVEGGFHAWRAAGLPTAPGGLLDAQDLAPGAAHLQIRTAGPGTAAPVPGTAPDPDTAPDRGTAE